MHLLRRITRSFLLDAGSLVTGRTRPFSVDPSVVVAVVILLDAPIPSLADCRSRRWAACPQAQYASSAIGAL
jgi:hypothetical protein